MSAFSILGDAFEIYKMIQFPLIHLKLSVKTWKFFENTQGLEELLAISEETAGSLLWN